MYEITLLNLWHRQKMDHDGSNMELHNYIACRGLYIAVFNVKLLRKARGKVRNVQFHQIKHEIKQIELEIEGQHTRRISCGVLVGYKLIIT